MGLPHSLTYWKEETDDNGNSDLHTLGVDP